MWEISFYEKNERCQVKDFLTSLSKREKSRTFRTIELLEKHGIDLELPHCKQMGNGLYELRMEAGVQLRIFYFFIKNNKIILTNGFIKKTQKTPASELLKARKYKKEFEERSEG